MVTIEAVLLDCDGTVVELHYDYMGARRAIVDLLAKRGFDRALFSEGDPVQVILEKLKGVLEANGRGYLFEGLKRQSEGIMDRFELEAAEKTYLMPWVLEAIVALRKAGLKLALVTNSGTKALELLFKRFLERSWFDVVVTREDVNAMKPDPAPISEALKRLGIPPSKAVIVGDSPVDVKAGLAAGAKAIGLASDPKRAQSLRKAGAQYVISSIEELPSLLAALRAS